MNILKHLEIILDPNNKEKFLKYPCGWELNTDIKNYTECYYLNRYRLRIQLFSDFSSMAERKEDFAKQLSDRLGNYLYGDLVDSLVKIKHDISNKNWIDAVDQIDKLIDEYYNLPKNLDFKNM
jgi:hypothetical protein